MPSWFRDLEIVEQLGSGVPRILEKYGRQAFEIRESYLRIIFPYAEPLEQITGQVTALLKHINGEMSRAEIQRALGLKHRDCFMLNCLQPALIQGLVEMTMPDKPNSRLQKYRLSSQGMVLRVQVG